MNFIIAVLHNKTLIPALVAWILAQILKVFTNYYKQKKFKAERLVGSGGMPSSHTSLVVGLAAAAGFNEGWNSAAFALSAVLAGVVMYDAAGVRQAAGKQAKVLNLLISELQTDHTIREKRLKELLGHTPVEVFAGALLGIVIAYVFMFIQ